MILIADSGSTKTEWCIAEGNTLLQNIITAGTNPYFQTSENLKDEIRYNLLPAIENRQVDSVFFYGAGCTTHEKKQIIVEAIQSCISAPIQIYSDLMGAARSLLGNKKGIACILGTGSNSCMYDGNQIIQNISPLGYILGDEGSGAVLGKLLVADCLKKQLPAHITKKFFDQYELTAYRILDQVYKQPFPNRYLAAFSYFLRDNLDDPAIYKLIYNSFHSFFIRNVMQYKDYEQYPISFTGSIAFYFQEVLKDVAKSLSIHIDKIEKTPMNGLIKFHS